jgi:hypothetical protein
VLGEGNRAYVPHLPQHARIDPKHLCNTILFDTKIVIKGDDMMAVYSVDGTDNKRDLLLSLTAVIPVTDELEEKMKAIMSNKEE